MTQLSQYVHYRKQMTGALHVARHSKKDGRRHRIAVKAYLYYGKLALKTGYIIAQRGM